MNSINGARDGGKESEQKGDGLDKGPVLNCTFPSAIQEWLQLTCKIRMRRADFVQEKFLGAGS